MDLQKLQLSTEVSNLNNHLTITVYIDLKLLGCSSDSDIYLLMMHSIEKNIYEIKKLPSMRLCY